MRLLVTRPEPDATRQAEILAARGHEPIVAPLLLIEPVTDVPLELDGVQGLIVTSRNVFRTLASHPGLAAARSLPLFAVGEATASAATELGFRFPATLDEWASESWTRTMLRRGDGIPWLDATARTRVRNFERVLNAFYPTVTNRRLTGARRALLRAASAWRYALGIYAAPYELRALHRLMRYQRPETTGF